MIACTNSEFQTFSFLGSQDTLDTRPVAIFSQIFECVFIFFIFMQRLLFKTFSVTWHVVKKLQRRSDMSKMWGPPRNRWSMLCVSRGRRKGAHHHTHMEAECTFSLRKLICEQGWIKRRFKKILPIDSFRFCGQICVSSHKCHVQQNERKLHVLRPTLPEVW